MSSESIREFDRQLQAGTAVDLVALGFNAGGRRRFQRVVEHEQTRTTQVVEFQVGHKGWTIGRFTVNLAVVNANYLPPTWTSPPPNVTSACGLHDLTRRLGYFRVPRRSLMDRLRGRHPEPSDHWWRHSPNPAVVRAELVEVRTLLLAGGLDWLTTRTTVAGLSWALQQLERRKAWKTMLGSPGTPRHFTLDPFPVAQ